MKIGIILHPYGEEKQGGLGRSIFERAKALLETDTQNEYTLFLKEMPTQPVEFPGSNWKTEVLGGGLFWIERLRKRDRQDVYIFNTPILPLFGELSRTIVIAHDFGYWYFGRDNFFGKCRAIVLFLYNYFSLRSADHIIAVSQTTKEEVMRLFRMPEKKIKVIYSGYKKICDIPGETKDVPRYFFFYLGALKERKNVLNIVKAFGEFAVSHKNYSLVLTGNPVGAYYERIHAYIKERGIESRVSFLGYISDAELSYVYKKARAFVFPTLTEGFGFSVLEALDCGVPVITSNQSSLKEVGGEAALLVDPYNVRDIASAMEKILKKDVRIRCIKQGYEHVKKFSWHTAAQELLEVVRTNN